MAEERVELAQFLNQQYLCESLTIKEVQTLIDYTEVVNFDKDEVIAEIGEIGDALYFIVSGEIIFARKSKTSQWETSNNSLGGYTQDA